MADTTLYETDILAWSEQQADVLRTLAARTDLPNALDLAHVVEEIEDVGLSEFNAVKSFIRQILVHVIKCWAEPNAQSQLHWHAEIGNFQAELAGRISASMRRRIELDVLWQRAIRQARLDLTANGLDSGELARRISILNAECPLLPGDIGAEASDPAALVARLAIVPIERD
jgi:hypothetical protein